MREAGFRRSGTSRGGSLAPRIARATATDVAALIELETAVFAGDRLSPRQLSYHVDNPSSDLLVARRASELLGYGLLYRRRGSSVARIYSIAVGASARGQGLGAQLLARLEATALAHGATQMRLEVRKDNLGAIALYERAGYQAFGERTGYYEDGEDAWRLAKRLGPPA